MGCKHGLEPDECAYCTGLLKKPTMEYDATLRSVGFKIINEHSNNRATWNALKRAHLQDRDYEDYKMSSR